jgi:uncharacterized protein
MAINDSQIFGAGVAFPPHLDASGQWAISVGAQNVRESLQILLLTSLGERLMYPGYGSSLRSNLFAPNNAATRKAIEEAMRTALKQWEPRITINSIVVVQDPANPQAAIATIDYQLVANQLPDQVTLTLQLQN